MAIGDTAKLVASLELVDKFSRPIGNIERSMGRLERRSGILSRGLGTALGIGIAKATSATIGLGKSAITAAIDYEDAFAGIKKTVNETDLTSAGLSFESLSESIRAMAREIPVAATDLARIGEAAGALGVRAQDIDDFTRVVAELSVTTDLTADTAATALGHLGTVLDLTGDDFRTFGDSLVALGNAGASTESEIIAVANRFAAAGKAAGLTNEEILALASATSSMGIQVEAAGSSLSRVFNSVATNIGTSNSKAKAFADALGLSAKEFRDAWERDALGTFEDFLGRLNELDQFQAASLLKKVGITGVRDVQAIRSMADNIDDVNSALETSRTATDALGIEAAKKFETTQAQLTLLRNRFTDVGIVIGDAVLPKIVELSKEFGDFLAKSDTQTAIKQFAAGIPGVVDDLVGIAKGIPWGAIGDAARIMGTGSKLLLQAFTSMPGWVQTAVVTGWGLNKLVGGGLGSILGDLTKRAFGQLRGATPATPVFTKEVGLGGAATGAAGGGLLGGGSASRFAKILGGVFAVGAAAAIADALEEPLQDIAGSLNRGIFGGTGGSIFGDFKVTELQWPFGPKNPPGPDWLQDILGTPEENKPDLGGGVTGGALGVRFGRRGTADNGLAGTVDDIPRVREEIRALRDDNREYDANDQRRFGSLEQRLIKDKSFAQELTPEKFIALLKRTSEFGAKGQGTTIEQGPRTGKDPTGQAFLALARRLPEEHLKDRAVMGELQRHIVAAEEVQAQAIKDGDLDTARKLQSTIDGIHGLLGTQDRTNALLGAQRDLISQGTSQQRLTAGNTLQQINQLSRLQTLEGATANNVAANTGVLRSKDFSPTINTSVSVTSQVSINDVLRNTVTQHIASGVRGGFVEGPG